MFQKAINVATLIFQFVDFVVKAIPAYVATPEGEKQWGDVLAAWVEADIFNPADVPTDQPTGEESSFDYWKRLGREFSGSQETTEVQSAPVGRKVTHLPTQEGREHE